MGTAAYMAPEQLDGTDATPATDIYALAAVAYEMLAGRPAYRGATPVEIAHAVVSGALPDLRESWPDAPPAASDALRHGMAFEGSARPRSASAFVDELERALEPSAPAPTAAMPRTRREPRRAAPAPAAAAEPFQRPPSRRRPRDRSLAPLLALLALAVVGGILAFVLLSGGDDKGDKSSSDSTSAAAEQRREARAERRRARRERQQQQEQAQSATPAPAPDESSGSPDTGGSSSSDYEVPQPSGDSPQEGARLQNQGFELINQGKYDEAIPVLERSVKSFPSGTDDPQYAYALFNLGSALRQAGRPDDAIPVLEERLKINNQRDEVQAELDKAKAAAG